jgi:hypothetical protein
MNKRIKDLWVKALTSGNYKQGKLCLRDNQYYCCLGVLCDLYLDEHQDAEWYIEDGYYKILGEDFILPHQIAEWANISENPSKDGVTLTVLNDDGTSFRAISKIISEKF